MSQLVECVSIGKFDLVEDASPGRQMRASGIFAVCNEATKNGRRYSEKLWEQNIARLQPAIKARRLVGELDHPSDGKTLLTRASHLITDLRIETRDGKRVVVGDMEVLDTARGRDLAALIKGRVEWGVSSRGSGSTKPRSDGTEDVSESDFRLYTFDAVFDPAADTAYPQVTESIETAGYVDIGIMESGEQAPSVLTEGAELPKDLAGASAIDFARSVDKALTSATKLNFDILSGSMSGASPFTRKGSSLILRLSSVMKNLKKTTLNVTLTLPFEKKVIEIEIPITGDPAADTYRATIPRDFSDTSEQAVSRQLAPCLSYLKKRLSESTDKAGTPVTESVPEPSDLDDAAANVMFARWVDKVLSADTGLNFDFAGSGSLDGSNPYRRTSKGLSMILSAMVRTKGSTDVLNIHISLPFNDKFVDFKIELTSAQPVIKKLSVPREIGDPPSAASVRRLLKPVLKYLKDNDLVSESTESAGEQTESLSKSDMTMAARLIGNTISAATGYTCDPVNYTDDGFTLELEKPGVPDAKVQVFVPVNKSDGNKVTVTLQMTGSSTVKVDLEDSMLRRMSSGALPATLKPITAKLASKTESEALIASALSLIESNARTAAAVGAGVNEALTEASVLGTLASQFTPSLPDWKAALVKKFGGKWRFVAMLKDGEALQFKFITPGKEKVHGNGFVVELKYDKGSDTYNMDLISYGPSFETTRVKFTGVHFDDFDQPEKYLYKFKTQKSEDAEQPATEPQTEQSTGIDPALHARTVDVVTKLTAALNETRGRLAETTRELAIARVVEGHHDPRAAREAIGSAVDPDLVSARFEAFSLKSGEPPATRAMAEANDLRQKLAETEQKLGTALTEAAKVQGLQVQTQGLAEVARRLATGRGLQVDHLVGQLSEASDAESVRRIVQESATLIPATGSVAKAIQEALASRRGNTNAPASTSVALHEGAAIEAVGGIPVRDLVARAG